jgi:catalase
VAALEALGLTGQPGVITGQRGEQVLSALMELLPDHRVWQRFPAATG